MRLVSRFVTLSFLGGALSACPGDDGPATSEASSTGDPASTSTSTTGQPDPDTGSSADATEGPIDTTGTTAGTTTDASSTGAGPTTTNGVIEVCGNNQIEGDEVCDLNQLAGESCESLGFQGGQLGCLLTCEDFNLLGCFICGNEVVDIAEDCEGTVPEEVTCESLGFEAGTISCGDDCLYDLSECSICGDGIQQGPEQCDGIDFGGQTCASLGFDMGNLACNLIQCAYVYTGCSGGQYIQDFEGGLMMPIEFQLDLIDPWTVDAAMPINGSNSARSGPLVAGGITNLTLEASFPAGGDVSFMHRESTAAGFDFLEFHIDGVMIQSWSGVNPAAMFSTPVAAGTHTLQWRFNRLGFINGGIDAVFVDDITLDGGVPL